MACAYLGATVYAHHLALERMKNFVAFENIHPEQLGALPFPPSLLSWDGLVRTSRGVYEMRIDLSKKSFVGTPSSSVPLDSTAPPIEYGYFPDAPQNIWITRARQLPEVQKVLWFDRFPVTRFHIENGAPVVEISDLRFPKMRPDRRGGFTYQVRFDAEGNVTSQGWLGR